MQQNNKDKLPASGRRAVIFTNGSYADLKGIKQRLRHDDWIVCADGALQHLVALQMWPHLLVGDFDSVDGALLAAATAAGVELLTFQREKDFTDTELAWQEVRQGHWREILVVGGWGGRLDHSLANLLLFAPFATEGYDIIFSDGCTDAYLVVDELLLKRCAGKLVSIISLTPQAAGVSTGGLHWPLTSATMHWGQGWGISNIAVSDTVQVQVEAGILLVVVTSED